MAIDLLSGKETMRERSADSKSCRKTRNPLKKKSDSFPDKFRLVLRDPEHWLTEEDVTRILETAGGEEKSRTCSNAG